MAVDVTVQAGPGRGVGAGGQGVKPGLDSGGLGGLGDSGWRGRKEPLETRDGLVLFAAPASRRTGRPGPPVALLPTRSPGP